MDIQNNIVDAIYTVHEKRNNKYNTFIEVQLPNALKYSNKLNIIIKVDDDIFDDALRFCKSVFPFVTYSFSSETDKTDIHIYLEKPKGWLLLALLFWDNLYRIFGYGLLAVIILYPYLVK